MRIENFAIGDHVKYVSKNGELMDGVIESIIPMFAKGKHDKQIQFINPRTKNRRDYMYSDIRIEYVISKAIANHDRLQDNSRFYYLLCG